MKSFTEIIFIFCAILFERLQSSSVGLYLFMPLEIYSCLSKNASSNISVFLLNTPKVEDKYLLNLSLLNVYSEGSVNILCQLINETETFGKYIEHSKWSILLF